MAQQYNNPTGGTASTIGTQHNTQWYYKNALIEAAEEQFFTPLADSIAMPKHYGKKIVQYLYVPLLDDRNVNDQGINAAGVTTVNGNLYGSSKDVGVIRGMLPTLTENGGRKNRVGFTRKTLEGTFVNYGFFYEYTEDSLQFDTDEELEEHVTREAVRGATQLSEDALQSDLLTSAGTVIYGGTATTNATVAAESIITYRKLLKLSLLLDDNHTPRKTKVMTGTRMMDTKTIPSARFAFIGSDLVPTLREMKDLHNNPAFIPVQHYAAGTHVLNGEIGMIDAIRFIQVPRMQKWAGAGATTSDTSVYTTGGKVDVYPMLIVGDGSFTTIGFQTGGKVAKFKIIHKKPGEAQANYNDPYGKTGFASIQWWYGFMAIRPERIALVKTAAKM